MRELFLLLDKIIDNAIGALIAGHDTSTIAMASLAHELAHQWFYGLVATGLIRLKNPGASTLPATEAPSPASPASPASPCGR